ncbi:hypothetical protein C0993_000703 [Termitomyces sp. T159_Od127]|nr:hypothetical protein C0993_000703 [Termitomyces sp. T159_Od127]
MVRPLRKRNKKRAKGTASGTDVREQFQDSVSEGTDLVGQISKIQLNASSEPRKKKRKTIPDHVEANGVQLTAVARERKPGEDGEVAVQAPKALPDPRSEQRKKKNKVPDGDSVTKIDSTSKSVPDMPRPAATSTSLPERVGEDVTMESIQIEETTGERENMKKAKKKQEQKKQKPQGESTLPKSSSSIEERSQVKSAHDNSATSGEQGAKESIIPVSTKPETGKSSTKPEKSHEKKKEKQRKSEQQRVEVDCTDFFLVSFLLLTLNSAAVADERSNTSPVEAMTKTQLNTQQVDKNDVELRHAHKEEGVSNVSNVNAKKSRKETRKLTTEERKAAEADVNAIFAKVLAAKRAAVATASVNVASTAKQGDVVPSSRSKKKKDPKNLNSQPLDSARPDTIPSNAGVEPLEDAAEHLKSTSGADCPKSMSTCPLCLLSPLHERMACPLVLGGPESLRERLLELVEASDHEQSDRTVIMSELSELLRLAEEASKIDVRPPHNTQLPKLAPAVRLVGDISDKSVSSNNVTSSHVGILTTQTNETSDTSDESSDDENPSHVNELSNISHDSKYLNELNLEDLIRGPISAAAQIADLDSSDSDEDEEDKEDNQVLEEDEPEVPRRSRKSGGVFDSSDEAESGLDDAQSIAEEVQSSAPDDAVYTPRSETDHVLFQAVDRIGKSQEVDRSADVAFGVALEMDTAVLNPAAVLQSSPSDPAKETAQSLAPSSRRVDLVNVTEATPPNHTSSLVLPVGPSAIQPLVPTPLTSLRDSPSAHDTPDETKLAGIVQRMRTRNGRTPTNEKNLETPTTADTPRSRLTQASQSVQDGVARRTRAATRRETLGAMTPLMPSVKRGRQSRMTLPASQPTEDLNVASTSQDVMPLDTWATLKPSSPALDADAMVDELEPSSPSQHDHVDVDIPHDSQDGPAEDSLFLQSESLPPFPYSQWNAESQEEVRQKPDENKINTSVQAKSREKPKQSQSTRYRRLTDITSDHGFLSTPTNLRATRSSTAAKKATDMYGRKDEIESESESDSDNSDAREESHIPKSRIAGKKRK